MTDLTKSFTQHEPSRFYSDKPFDATNLDDKPMPLAKYRIYDGNFASFVSTTRS